LKIKFHLLSNYVVLIYWFHALILPPTTDSKLAKPWVGV